jgi:hypothetical protein
MKERQHFYATSFNQQFEREFEKEDNNSSNYGTPGTPRFKL